MTLQAGAKQTLAPPWKLPRFRRALLFCLLPLALLAACHGSAASFTVTLDRDTISLGDTATLSLVFEGGNPDSQPTLPAISNLRVVPVGQSSQYRMVNGRGTSTVSFNYQVTPAQVGSITIPAFSISVGGQRLSSQALTLKVLKPDAPPPTSDAAASQLAFLKLSVPGREMVVGEAITAELQLWVRDGVQNISDFQITSQPADGVALGKFVQGGNRRSQVGGVGFTIVPFVTTLTSQQAGNLKLGPVTCIVVVAIPSNRRPRDPFESVFGVNQEQRRLSLASEEVILHATPLPATNAPASFTGAVGDFTMTASVGPTNVAVGDPITVKIQISGRGPIESLTLPAAEWREFKTYPPTTKVETADPFGMQGSKSFEQVVVPLNAEVRELPPIEFSFYDAEKKTFRTLRQPATPLTVRPTGSIPQPFIGSNLLARAEEPQIRQDIAPIKQRPGTLEQLQPPMAGRTGFLLFQLLPVLALAVSWGWRHHADSLAANPRLRRQRQVARFTDAGLADLRRHAAARDSDTFFATIFRLLQEQIGERLDAPASSITEAVVAERLRPRGVPDAMLEALEELFEACNSARYAPVRDEQELAGFIPKVEQALHDLRSLKS
jgi:ribosomal protein S18 acetylase RimI-like enzyme